LLMTNIAALSEDREGDREKEMGGMVTFRPSNDDIGGCEFKLPSWPWGSSFIIMQRALHNDDGKTQEKLTKNSLSDNVR